eukprot:Nk52_evm8s241 gene=Nk52_evmTU8s241
MNMTEYPADPVKFSGIDWKEAAVCILIPNIGGAISAYLGRRNGKAPGDDPWYKSLKKSPLNPPPIVFPIMWTTLYTITGFAAYLVKRAAGFGTALGFFIGQLVMNWLWTPLFFRLQRVDLAFYDIAALLGVASYTTYLFSTVQAAGLEIGSVVIKAWYLMIPYLAWLGLATHLNFYILRKNPHVVLRDHSHVRPKRRDELLIETMDYDPSMHPLL